MPQTATSIGGICSRSVNSSPQNPTTTAAIPLATAGPLTSSLAAQNVVHASTPASAARPTARGRAWQASRPSFLIDGVVVCDAPGGTSSPSARQERVGDVEDEVAAGGVEPGGAQGADQCGQDGVAFGSAGAAGSYPAGARRERSRPRGPGPDPASGGRAGRGARRHGAQDVEGVRRSRR